MGKVKIKMPKDVTFILDKLNTKDSTAYIVGGCVRDSLMHNTPHDWDICTSLKPEQIKEVFSEYRTIDTGIKHGTVTVVINDNLYEVTTYRIDGEYDDFRHPSNVTFTKSIVEDLSRRDFTINAMAYNEARGLIDPFDGFNDIKRKVIKCVGNPDDRFNEDALRILRAERFSATLNFMIDTNTEESMMRNRHLLKNIAMERINAELVKTISKPQYHNDILFRMLQVVLPDYITDTVVNETEFTLSRNRTMGVVTMAFLLKMIYDSNNCLALKLPTMLQELKFSNKDVKSIYLTFCCFERCLKEIDESIRTNSIAQPRITLKYILRDCDEWIAKDVMELMKLWKERLQQKAVLVGRYANRMIEDLADVKEECYTLKELHINGDDLLAIGIHGKDVGTILNSALDGVICGELQNEHDSLMSFVKHEKDRIIKTK